MINGGKLTFFQQDSQTEEKKNRGQIYKDIKQGKPFNVAPARVQTAFLLFAGWILKAQRQVVISKWKFVVCQIK